MNKYLKTGLNTIGIILFGRWQIYMVGAIILLSIALTYSISRISFWKSDSQRHENNFVNADKEIKSLVLTVNEFKHLSTDYKEKADSLLKINQVKPRQVKEITMVDVQYRDSCNIPIKPVTTKVGEVFKSAVGYSDQCWGFSGEILSKDPQPEFTLKDRTANNAISLVVTRDKYFLGFLWRTKKADYKAKSKCGEIQVTNIEFTKR